MNLHLIPSFKTVITAPVQPEQIVIKNRNINIRFFYGANVINYLYQVRTFQYNVFILNLFLFKKKNGTCILAGSKPTQNQDC